MLGDLNGDGRLDAVIATFGPGPGFDVVVRVHLGGAGGLFDPPSTFVVTPGVVAFIDLAIADVTGEGIPDLLVATAFAGGRVHVLQGDGAGGFVPAAFGFVGAGRPVAIAASDLNGDGAPDVVILNPGGTLTVHPSDGTGGFGAPVTVAALPAGATPAAVALGDLNGDALLDAAVSSANSPTVAVLFGDGAGGFPLRSEFLLSANPAVRAGPLALGDLTGDGRPDLAVANRTLGGLGGVYVLVGDGAGGFVPALGSPFAVFDGFATSVTLGDVDGNGLLDVVTPGEGITILLNHPAF